jgi:hypothetical protein
MERDLFHAIRKYALKISQYKSIRYHACDIESIPMELFTSHVMYEHANYQEQVELNVDSYRRVKGKFFGHSSSKLVKIELHVNVDPTHTISNLMKYSSKLVKIELHVNVDPTHTISNLMKYYRQY